MVRGNVQWCNITIKFGGGDEISFTKMSRVYKLVVLIYALFILVRTLTSLPIMDKYVTTD